MNLTCHEFTICQRQRMSPVILSEFAGSAHCLSGAILVNPWDQREVVKAIHKALLMPEETKKIRHKHNYEYPISCSHNSYVQSHDTMYWVNSFLKTVEEAGRGGDASEEVLPLDVSLVKQKMKESKRRVFLLDYDGTLAPITKVPREAIPTPALLQTLKKLCQDPQNCVYIISGRDRPTLSEWFRDIPLGMSCEHGSFFRSCPVHGGPVGEWENVGAELDMSWKETVQNIFDDYADRVPGSFVEVKEVGLTWHYRNADPDFGEYQKNDLVLHLQHIAGLPVDILAGKKAVEVRPQGVNKGSVVKRILAMETNADFYLCMGDDVTDEDMFEELNKADIKGNKFSVTIGKKPSQATFFLSQTEVLQLFQQLTES